MEEGLPGVVAPLIQHLEDDPIVEEAVDLGEGGPEEEGQIGERIQYGKQEVQGAYVVEGQHCVVVEGLHYEAVQGLHYEAVEGLHYEGVEVLRHTLLVVRHCVVAGVPHYMEVVGDHDEGVVVVGDHHVHASSLARHVVVEKDDPCVQVLRGLGAPRVVAVAGGLCGVEVVHRSGAWPVVGTVHRVLVELLVQLSEELTAEPYQVEGPLTAEPYQVEGPLTAEPYQVEGPLAVELVEDSCSQRAW